LTSNGSWQKVRFDEICKNISDRIDDPKQAETDYYVGLEHLDSEDPKISRHGSPQDVSATKLKFKTGQILFGKRRWYLRKVAVAEREGICSAHMMVLESIDDKIKKEFLSILMQGDEFFEKALSVSAGSLSPTIKWKDLSTLEFLIPSIEQQEEILSLTHKIDDTISNAQNLLEKTKNYMVSRRELLLTRGIGHTKFKKIPWHYGKTIEIPEEWKEKKLYKLAKIEWGDTSITKKSYIEKGFPSFSATGNDGFLPQAGWDGNGVVLSAIGEHCGKCFYATGKWNAIKNTIIIQSDETLAINKYLYYFLNDQSKWNIDGSGQPFITLKTTKNFLIPLPPIPEQKQITSILSNIDEQITQQQSHLTNLKVLRKSILNSKLTKEKYN